MPIYRLRPQLAGGGGASMCLMCQMTKKDPRQWEPSKYQNGQSYRERLAKETFWSPATKGLKKDSDRALTPAVEAVCVPEHLALPGSLQAKQLCHLHAQFSLGWSCHRQKSCVYAHRVASVMSSFLWSCRLACQSSLSGEFTRQEYGSALTNTSCHTLLEHCISRCPSRRLPWVPGAARIPATQAAAAPPHLALTGVDPSPPGKPQEQTPVDDPHEEVKIKQLKSRGSVTKEKEPKPLH